MQAVTLFSLAKHAGEYKDWPLKTPLLLNYQSTSLAIPGFQLLHQFQLQSGGFCKCRRSGRQGRIRARRQRQAEASGECSGNEKLGGNHDSLQI